MSGFTIPGLGFAKPNETLPPLPADVAAAAASVEEAKAGPSDEKTKNTTTESHPPDASSSKPDDAMNVDREASPADLTGALEAFLGGAEPMTTDQPTATTAAVSQNVDMSGTLERPQQEGEGDHPEWEVDSSPYESSSESSSDSSDDEDDDKDGGYELLGIDETARMLMEAGSDDEGEGGKSGGNNQLRTKNEKAVEPVPKPDVKITPEMKIEELGAIDHIVENVVVIKAFTPGEYQVLDSGTVLCTENREVFGAIAEVIGKVLQPIYTVMFSTPEEITQAGLEVGTKVYYSVDHAAHVFTQPLRNMKGSDASNLHDEEVAEDEMEFSDDEKEAEHKRQIKQKRKEKAAARGGAKAGGRGGSAAGGDGGQNPHPLRNEVKPAPASSSVLNYDDEEEDDGPYKPLQRPASFVSGPPIQQNFIEEPEPGTTRFGGYRGGRGDFRGRGRGRGDRGRGRGGGGRGRGGGSGGGPYQRHQHQKGGRHNHDDRDSGYSQPQHGGGNSQSPRQHLQHQQQQPQQHHSAPGGSGPSQSPPAAAPFNFNIPGLLPQQPTGQQQQGNNNSSGSGFPAFPPPPPGWPAPQQGGQPAQGQQQGAHINPAFFAALLSQMQRNQGQGQGQGQGGGQQPWGGQQPPPPPPQ